MTLTEEIPDKVMATVTGLTEAYDGYLKTAERLGLEGTEAVKFANDQADREERRAERERTREESERQRQYEIEMEKMRLERASVESTRASESYREVVASSRPKLPPFVDAKTT